MDECSIGIPGHLPISSPRRRLQIKEEEETVSAFKRSSRRFATTVALGIAALALSAPVAQAGTLADSATSCADQTYSQPFLPWADPASYVLAPNGNFEHGSGSWSLSGGAAVA